MDARLRGIIPDATVENSQGPQCALYLKKLNSSRIPYMTPTVRSHLRSIAAALSAHHVSVIKKENVKQQHGMSSEAQISFKFKTETLETYSTSIYFIVCRI